MLAPSFTVLRLGDFRRLLLTRMFLAMALQSQAIIVGWQIFSLTHNTLMLGYTGLAEAVPALSCALFAGYIVDSSRPHRVYAICVGAVMLNTLMLLLFAGGFVHAPTDTLIPWIFGGIFVSGVARSFIMPSSYSLLSQIVPRDEIPAASAWLSSGFQIAAITGPAVAGILYGWLGPRVAWMMPFSLVSVSFFVLLSMSAVPKTYRSREQREAAVTSIRAGFAFMWGNPVLLSLMGLDMLAVLLGGAVAVLPAYADQVLHIGSQGLGALRAAPATGAVIAALILAFRPMKKIRATTMLWVVAGFGVSMIGFGLSHIFWLSMAFLAFSGVCDSISVVIRSTLVQLLTPDAMRGRVSSVNSMFIISSNELGAFESGTAAKLLGLIPSVVMGGIGTLAVVIGTSILSPKLRRTVVDTGEQRL